MGLMLSTTTWAVCPETSLTKKMSEFDFSGKMKITATSDGTRTSIDSLEYKPGSESYEYIKTELSSDFKLMSSVYIDQIEPVAYFFVQNQKTCMNSIMITAGDDGYLYFINSISDKQIDTTEEESKTQFIFEKN